MKHASAITSVALATLLTVGTYYGGWHSAGWWLDQASHFSGKTTTLVPRKPFAQLTLPPPRSVSLSFQAGDRVDIYITHKGEEVPILLDCLLTKGPNPVTIILPIDFIMDSVTGTLLLSGEYSVRKTLSPKKLPRGLPSTKNDESQHP